jgi:hypothetical protein
VPWPRRPLVDREPGCCRRSSTPSGRRR